MNNTTQISISGVWSNYKSQETVVEEDKKWAWSYYVVRPVSVFPTVLFLKLGVSANQVTWLSIVILLAGCFLLAVGNYFLAIVGALLVNTWLVLDFVDGNIARYQKLSSAYGGFLDALGGYIIYGFMFFSVGVGSYFYPNSLLIARIPVIPIDLDPVIFLIVGAWASLITLWSRLVYQKFKNSFADLEMHRLDMVKGQGDASVLSYLLWLGNNLFNVSGFLLAFLLGAVIFGLLDVFLVASALANTLILFVSLARLLKRGRTI